ncbi:MAG: PaaI family thioesterase [Pseudomonadota bacterium]
MSSDLSVDTANALLQANFAPWVLSLKPVVTQTASDSAHLLMPFDGGLNREGGIVSGQALMALADTAMVVAVFAAMGEFCPVATVNMNTTFMRGAKESDVLAKAKIAKKGRALTFVNVDLITTSDERLVCQASGSYAMPRT